MKKIIIIIPTYNEAENIKEIIPAILNVDSKLNILVVDDNSPDGTADIVSSLQEKNKNIFLIKRKKKTGLGTAYIEGFRFALENNYSYIMEMDADFSHNPEDIPKFLETIKTNDLVIGSRYTKGISVVNWPLNRILLSFFASKYVRIITGLPVKDSTAGFKCFTREAIESLDLNKVKSNGYSFQIEITHKLWKRGYRIKEIPVIFIDRHFGKTKMNNKIVWEAIWIVWQLKLGFIR